MTGGPEVFHAAVLDRVPHGFFGRRGGVSAGEYASANMGPGSDDDAGAVAANRAAAAATVKRGATLLTPYQTHSNECITVRVPFANGLRPPADAIVTDRPDVAIGIVTADCAPVLLADPDANVVGAAHAGWRGALDGVTDTTIMAMEAIGAARDRIVAAIGPCIARASYEVDDAFRRRFETDDAANERFFGDADRAGHARFDLEGYVLHRLAIAGVTKVTALGMDTCADATRFFSYRRSTQAGERGYGRQIAIIAPAGD